MPERELIAIMFIYEQTSLDLSLLSFVMLSISAIKVFYPSMVLIPLKRD